MASPSCVGAAKLLLPTVALAEQLLGAVIAIEYELVSCSGLRASYHATIPRRCRGYSGSGLVMTVIMASSRALRHTLTC